MFKQLVRHFAHSSNNRNRGSPHFGGYGSKEISKQSPLETLKILSSGIKQKIDLKGQCGFDQLRRIHLDFISGDLNQYLYDERLQVDIKTYEMNSGMYVTHLKNVHTTSKHELPLVMFGDPILTSTAHLHPPIISTLLRKYSRIYIVDLPGVGLSNDKKLSDKYLPFRETLDNLDPNFRIKKSSSPTKFVYLTDIPDSEYLNKIDKIREFYFDEAFDEFITQHKFKKIEMLTTSMSTYLVVKFFENHTKSIIDKLHIAGRAPLTKSMYSIDKYNPRDVFSRKGIVPGSTFIDMILAPSVSMKKTSIWERFLKTDFCLLSGARSYAAGVVHSFSVDKRLPYDPMHYRFLVMIFKMISKEYHNHFDATEHVAYNLFTNNFFTFEDFLFTYKNQKRFININSFQFVEPVNKEFLAIKMGLEITQSEFKNSLNKAGAWLLDVKDAEHIVGDPNATKRK